ncbi:MAG: AMP-binding protein [Candidatus Dormibacteraceae bacterium]
MDAVSIGEVIWRPSPEVIGRSRLQRFIEEHGLGSYQGLLARVETDPDWFWAAMVRDVGIQFYRPFDAVVDRSRGLPFARFWPGARMNIVATCIDQHLEQGRGDHTALIFEGEPGERHSVSYRELSREVCRLAAALGRLEVRQGDRVGIYMPMSIETAVAILACAKIGAVFIPLFSGFGSGAVAARLRDCQAKLLICSDGYHRRGSVVAMKEVADRALVEAPSVKYLLMQRRVGREVPWNPERDRIWEVLVEDMPDHLATTELNADDPLMVLYTSGTTGQPKGAFHVHGGFPVKAAQDLAHAFDMDGDDIIFWYTDIGWMMGPWLILGSLALGATAVLYEGAPDHPDPDRLWRICSELGVSILGVSPTLVRALMVDGHRPASTHDLSALRILGGTGEPWNPESFQWFFQDVGGGRLPIINYSGGTEISGGILAGNVLSPLRPCSFAGPVPGMSVAVLNEQGESVRQEVGELCLRQPWPGMTQGFWGGDERYLQAYWSRFPETWVHGDWAYIAEDGLWYLLGRSDDTIKMAGKRLGPAELEAVLTQHEAVWEAAAIGVAHPLKGEVAVCFVVLRPGHQESQALRDQLLALVIDHLGKPLAPQAIHFLPELPRTRNAKILRRIIKAVYLGAEPGDLSSLENPTSLDPIARLLADRGEDAGGHHPL